MKFLFLLLLLSSGAFAGQAECKIAIVEFNKAFGPQFSFGLTKYNEEFRLVFAQAKGSKGTVRVQAAQQSIIRTCVAAGLSAVFFVAEKETLLAKGRCEVANLLMGTVSCTKLSAPEKIAVHFYDPKDFE